VKYVSEYRDADTSRRIAEAIDKAVTRAWAVMEVCGGQTHSIVKNGIDQLLPEEITLIHGPGCPVCVTPLETIDRAIALAKSPDVTFCSFGDMLRVPGSEWDLLSVKAAGGDVRIVYSPMDAVKLSATNPDRQVVFFAVGFETTAPATAIAAHTAREQGLMNFSLLTAHVLVPPAIEAILKSPDCRVQGFLAAGHVCAVMGYTEYEPISAEYKVPIVVTGFEPVDILQGILMCVNQLEEGRADVENQYKRVVQREGNPSARALMNRVYEPCDRKWRGIGTIPGSGLKLREEYAEYDAERKFDLDMRPVEEPSECKAGLVLQGVIKPNECPAFGVQCTPDQPLGAPMVSAEGACAAYYRYRRSNS
jgi:hydrogenase expression/formation protein HypD